MVYKICLINNISYTINASYRSPALTGMNRAIQLGSPFCITITGEAKLGGFWSINLKKYI